MVIQSTQRMGKGNSRPYHIHAHETYYIANNAKEEVVSYIIILIITNEQNVNRAKSY